MIESTPISELKYPVMEHFATIQGEGFHAGTAAYFVRLGGCDVGCVWCDVKESWPILGHPEMTSIEIADLVSKSGLKTVVITGGEPTMHNLAPLTRELKSRGLQNHIETSGTNALTGSWDWVTFSPKKFKAPVSGFGNLASELKIIVFNKSDFEFGETHAENVHSQCELYLQPEWDRRNEISDRLVAYVLLHSKWKISIQSHKYLNIP
jgi:7-carboxy-7-deazaguanine synthase